jgi:nucleoside-diphosphate-sugar epimerase
VYGVKKEENVTEELALEPLTDYSKYKALCEDVLFQYTGKDFVTLIIRPATVCGYSPRLRLDLTVNILTNLAINKHEITVFGGEQKRPNIHIEDMTDLYVKSLEYPDEVIQGKIFNAGYENYQVKEIANTVKEVLNDDTLVIKTVPTDDHRSYHISSEKIKRELGFTPGHTVKEAVQHLKTAFLQGKIPNPLTDVRYYNIKTMQKINLS